VAKLESIETTAEETVQDVTTDAEPQKSDNTKHNFSFYSVRRFLKRTQSEKCKDKDIQ
jgi:hypothetical protein